MLAKCLTGEGERFLTLNPTTLALLRFPGGLGLTTSIPSLSALLLLLLFPLLLPLFPLFADFGGLP